MADYFLGLDFGTSGARSCVIDAAESIVHEGRFAYPSPAHQQPEDWQLGLSTLLDDIPSSFKQFLAALAIDGTSGTVLLADEKGRPLGPALLYSDNRAVAETDEIVAVAGSHTAASAMPGLAKLLWLVKQPEAAQARFACHQADWLAGQLTGCFGMSDFHNALKSGFDVENLCWPAWLDHLPVRPLLPKVLEPGAVIAPLSPEAAARFGLPASCIVRAGTTDSIAAFMASGAGQPGEAVTSLGTTLVLKLLSETRVEAQEYGVYSHRYGKFWLAGGASNTGGGVLKQFFSDDELTKLSARIDPATVTGLDYVPLLKPGERFPVNDHRLQPRLTPRPADDAIFLQGLLEAMSRIEHEGYDRLRQLGASPVRKIFTAGGGAKNLAWQAIRQRMLGVLVCHSGFADAAYGAARLARQGLSIAH